MKKILATVAVLSTVVLTSCGGGLPGKGYSKYKQMNTDYLLSIGGTGKEITYNSCNYVEITGDGTLSAKDLVGVVYYRANWTMRIGSGMDNRNVYFTYYSSFEYVTEEDSSQLYYYALDLVDSGALRGRIGSL